MRNYIYMLTAFFLLLPNFTFGQYQFEWEHIYSRTSNSFDQSAKIGADNEGNYYVLGNSSAPGVGSGILVIKYNQSGDTVWTKIYPGGGPSDFIVKNNGDFYITSHSRRTFKCNSEGNVIWSSIYADPGFLISMAVDADDNTYVISEGGTNGLKIIKYDSNGNQQWVKNYDNAWGVKVILDNGGNIIVGGNSGASSEDFLALKYNPHGDLLWSQTYRRSNIAGSLTAISVDNSNNVIMGGYAPESVANFYHDFTVVKLNLQGEFQWVRFYNGPNNRHDILVDVVTDNEENIFVGGNSFDQSSVSTAVIIKYSPTGDSLAAFEYSGETNLRFGSGKDINTDDGASLERMRWDFAQSELYGFFLQGGPTNSISSAFLRTYDLIDMVLIILTDLTPVNYQSPTLRDVNFGNTNNQNRNTNTNANPDILIIADAFNPTLQRVDIITAKFSDKTVNVENELINPANFILHQNYPNPFNPSTKISWQVPVGSHQVLKVFDVLGSEVASLVDEYREAGRYEAEFNASNLSSGVYFYTLKSGSITQAKKLLLMK